MVYQPDDPDDGSAHDIPIITPKYHPIYESLRHGHPVPSSTSSSASEQVVPSRKPLSLHQQVIRPPTDEECGLPDLYTTTLSAIPSPLLPLSKHLSTSFSAVVLNGYSRSELAEGLAHALHLRRCNGGARAVLVVTNSEAAVREWMSALCSVLDEIQFISYSRNRAKHDATMVRLRDTQFPGIVVAAEKAAREGFTEMWEALRENRLVKKWEMVVSEAVTDTNAEGICSPLRMVKEGTAENGVVLARKGLSRTKAVGVVRELDSLDMDAFWLRNKDLSALVEEREKRNERATRRGRQSPVGKENRASLRNRDISDENMAKSKPEQPPKGRKHSPHVTTRKRSPVVPRMPSTSNDDKRLSSGTDSSTDLRRSIRIPTQTASGEGSKLDEVQKEKPAILGPIKPRQAWNRISPELLSQLPGPRRRNPRLSPPATSDKAPVALRQPRNRISPEIQSQLPGPRSRNPRLSQLDASDKAPVAPRQPRNRISPELLSQLPGPRSRNTRLSPPASSDKAPVVPRQPRNRISPELLSQLPGSRSRNPRSSPPAASNEASITPRSKVKLRKRRTSTPDSAKQPVTNPPLKETNRTRVRSRGSSSNSVVLNRTEMTNEDDDNTTSSYRNKEKVLRRARALRIYDTDSSEETFYTPPSRPKPVSPSSSSPDKFYTPRSSLSPKVTTDSTRPRRNSLFKIVSRKESSPRIREPEPVKSASIARVPLRTGAKGKGRIRNFGESDSSDDEPLSTRLGIRKARDNRRSGKNRGKESYESDSSDDEPLSTRLDIRKAKDRRRAKISLSPPRSGRKAAVQPTSETPRREKAAKRHSVFDGLLSPALPSSQRGNESRRRHSLAGPVRVKYEFDTSNRERPPIFPNGRKSLPNIMKREDDDLFNRDARLAQGSSLPRTSYMLPLKRRSLETRKTRNTRDAPRNSRSRPDVRLPSRSPVRTSSVPRPASRPVPPDVIILISDSEEDTARDTTAAKKRRLVSNSESRRTTQRNNAEAETSRRRIQRQNRPGPSNHPQVRSTHPLRDVHVSKEDDMGSFVRGRRNRNLRHLTVIQRKKYDKHVAEAKRYERMGRLKKAIDSYEKCVQIYDGDHELADRFLALSSRVGCLRSSDFSEQPAGSPIRKKSRRRRNSGRAARRERSNSRIDVIDLTSS